MFERTRVALVASLASSFCGGALAATTGNLSLSGTIDASACSLALSNNGNLDYGSLTTLDVEKYDLVNGVAYKAPDKKLTLSIDCDSPKVLWISLSDNRSDSVFLLGAPDDINGFGLGKTSTSQSIGQYHVTFANLMATSNANVGVMKPHAYFVRPNSDLPGGWIVASGSMAGLFHPKQDLAFDVAGEGTPSKISRVSGPIGITTYFNKSLVNSAQERIVLNGSSTFTIHYL